MGRFRYGRVRKAGSDIGPDEIRPDQRGPNEILAKSDIEPGQVGLRQMGPGQIWLGQNGSVQIWSG